MFKDLVPHARLSYSIDSELIAIGNTTWQTKNVTSVSVEHESIPMLEAEPAFAAPEPTRKFGWGVLLLGIAIAWTWSLSFQQPSYVGWPLTVFLALATWFIGHYSHKNMLTLWNQRRANVTRQRSVWQNLAVKTPELYRLIIDSSSGKSVALTALEFEPVNVVHTSILAAMRSTSAVASRGVIDTVAVSKGSPEDLYEKFCAREISRA